MSDIAAALFKNHLQRLRAGADQASSIAETSKWIAANTFIGGRPYSYKNHEYQQRILDSEAREVNVRKASQVGLSEKSIRKALAMCGMIRNFTCIYTLPTAHLAATIMKTRVNPVIETSPYLRDMVADLDNTEVKRIGTSYLYLKGAASSNAPISIPADMLVHDELDFSDPLVISQYQSRLTHSPYRIKLRLSTPTIPGKGIDFEFQRSKRYFNFVKCSCCGHFFIPDYYDHVKIPGFSGDLHDIKKSNLHRYSYLDARVMCPKCGKAPDLGPNFREWVCENPDENHVADGFQVTPFDAPFIVTPGFLVEASTQYQDVADFINFALGLPYFSQESVLSPDEVRACCVQEEWAGMVSHVMGVDLGKTCHIVVAACSWDGAMQVRHIEDVPLQQLRERYIALRMHYRVRMSVIDSLPYTDTVMALQAIDHNLYASVYAQFRGTELFQVKQRDEEKEKGVTQMRQINVARDRTFDALMAFIRSGQFSKLSCGRDDDFVLHCTDMRRVKDWSAKAQEMEFRWVKSELGDDHYWFALSYAFLAKHIIGASTGLAGALPLVSTFKVRQAP